MFEKLGDAFSKAAKGFSEKDLNEKDIEDVLSERHLPLFSHLKPLILRQITKHWCQLD